ncbi:MAG TPA: hypothetical protein VGC24_01005 [Burkholderiaceae bacterium]
MGISAGALGTSALTMQLGGAASGAIGSYFGAQTQRTNANAQAAIADTNARIAELGAQSALRQGQQQTAAYTLQAGQKMGAQRAAQAANGVDLGVGSAAEVRASSAILKDIDVNQINANAVANAWGYRTQATNYSNQALTARATAGSVSPLTSATTSLLGSASSIASTWYSQNKAGLTGDASAKGVAADATDYSLSTAATSNYGLKAPKNVWGF